MMAIKLMTESLFITECKGIKIIWSQSLNSIPLQMLQCSFSGDPVRRKSLNDIPSQSAGKLAGLDLAEPVRQV
jgi:hypothetical protein